MFPSLSTSQRRATTRSKRNRIEPGGGSRIGERAVVIIHMQQQRLAITRAPESSESICG